jgi:hypothetical protein
MRMKLAGNTCAMIHETLRVVAEEEGREALWNLADIKEVFGLDPKKRASGDDKGGPEDKYQRCQMVCRDICGKVKDEEEDCDLFLHHLHKFEKQLGARRRKRKAVALGVAAEGGGGSPALAPMMANVSAPMAPMMPNVSTDNTSVNDPVGLAGVAGQPPPSL